MAAGSEHVLPGSDPPSIVVDRFVLCLDAARLQSVDSAQMVHLGKHLAHFAGPQIMTFFFWTSICK
jgi:hypothetical protein